jgi:periplasmic divalent cation tolerance protein
MCLAVLVTCPEDSAERIAREILQLRLAACVNIINRVRSRYWWKGRLDSTDESLLLIKTRSELFEKLERTVKRIHPYETPEIIGLGIERGSRPYLDWILKETRPAVKKTDRR